MDIEKLNKLEKKGLFPFKFLGYDEKYHYFLPIQATVLFNISKGNINKMKLLELAPLYFWETFFMTKNGIIWTHAIDWLIQKSVKTGFFDIDKIRGSGIWQENNEIIINTGKEIINHTKKYKIETYRSENHYIKSNPILNGFSGRESTIEEGKQLLKLFDNCNFENSIQMYSALGWALIAPFAGLLKWRPHLWVTGQSGSGKSYLLDELLFKLCGDYTLKGSGNDSEASIRRALNKDARPVLKDEMEPGQKGKKEDSIQAIIELARNASSDASCITMKASQGGGYDIFKIRSCFCFASIVPYLQGSAIESRFTIARLKRTDLKQKIMASREILKTGFFQDPSIFRRRVFQNIDQVLKDIVFLEDFILKNFGDKRAADQLSPLFSAVNCILSDVSIKDNKKFLKFLTTNFDYTLTAKDNDEEKLIDELFSFIVRSDEGNNYSIGELIQICIENDSNNNLEKLLGQNGIRILRKDLNYQIAIVYNHREVRKALHDTIYYSRYGEILQRHEATKETKTKAVRISGRTQRCIVMEWDILKKNFTDNYSNVYIENETKGEIINYVK